MAGAGGASQDAERRAIRALARRIARAPHLAISGTYGRAVRAVYLRRNPPQSLYYLGSLNGGRYTPKGGPAGLYLADNQPTASAEIGNLLLDPDGRPLPLVAHEPVTFVSANVELRRVLDLTDAAVRRALRVSRRAIVDEWRPAMLVYLQGNGPMPVTQRIALAAHVSSVISGILYPSARLGGGRCLVVFPDRLASGDFVEVYDPSGFLAQRLPPRGP